MEISLVPIVQFIEKSQDSSHVFMKIDILSHELKLFICFLDKMQMLPRVSYILLSLYNEKQ